MTSSKLKRLPKALPPNTLALEVRASTYDFGRGGQTFIVYEGELN